MTDKEIEAYRKRLNELTSQGSDDKSERKWRPEFKKLAREVGASTCSFWVSHTSGSKVTDADTSELIRNIHQALQTASMVNMCKTAAQGYEMATKASEDASLASKSASRQFRITAWIGALTASAACLSAGAALFAVFRN